MDAEREGSIQGLAPDDRNRNLINIDFTVILPDLCIKVKADLKQVL